MKARQVMRTLALLLAVVVCSGALLAGDPSPEGSESVAELKQRIHELEAEVERQQVEIEMLREELRVLRKKGPLVVPDLEEEVPEGARPFQYEGRRYYIIPLPADAAAEKK